MQQKKKIPTQPQQEPAKREQKSPRLQQKTVSQPDDAPAQRIIAHPASNSPVMSPPSKCASSDDGNFPALHVSRQKLTEAIGGTRTYEQAIISHVPDYSRGKTGGTKPQKHAMCGMNAGDKRPLFANGACGIVYDLENNYLIFAYFDRNETYVGGGNSSLLIKTQIKADLRGREAEIRGHFDTVGQQHRHALSLTCFPPKVNVFFFNFSCPLLPINHA
jgi:hypothetical protein